MHPNRFVKSYFDAWNHHDPVAVANHLAAEGTYCDVPENRHRTHPQLVRSLRNFFSEYRHRYEPIGEVVTGQNTIAFQYRMSPKARNGGNGTLLPVHGAEFITLRGDTAITITDYYEWPADSVLTSVSGGKDELAGEKYAKSGLSEQQMRVYKQRLEDAMLAQQAYLRSDLTLPKLAKSIDCSVNHLSQVINAGFGMSFFDYLNHFRIEHAKRLLSEMDSRGGAVLNIAFTVGYNSNSAFYAAFKKYVGETPAQFRKQQQHLVKAS